MIVNNKNGDSLAVAFSKILNKSLKKKAEDQSAGKILLESVGEAQEEAEMENKADDPFASENFLSDRGYKSSEADSMTNSIDDSLSMISDSEKAYSESPAGTLVDLGDSEPDSLKTSKQIMRGLGKIARSLSNRGESFAADVVIAAAHEINEEMVKEAAKVRFVQNELMKIASELDMEGDSFSRDMVIATAKNL